MKCLFYILILLPIIGLSQPFRGSQNSANKNTGSILVHDFSVNEEEEPEPEPQPANYDFLVTSSASGTDNDTLTLAQALDSIPYMTAGDTLAFNKGENFEITETITIPSGVVIISHGTGADPILYGSGTITGWSVYSGNIYSTTTADVDLLSENGVKMRLASLDNDASDYVFDYKVTSITNDNTFVTNIPSEASNYYQGATVYYRTRDWTLEDLIVSSSTGSTLNTTTPHYKESSYGTYNGGIYLVNHLNFLDQAGEWYHDGSTTLYFWATDNDDPDNHVVRGSILDTMFICGESVKISGLDIRDVNRIAIYIPEDSVKISDCSISNIDNIAIVTNEADYDSIVRCNISQTTVSAIDIVEGHHCYLGYDTISYNHVFDILGKGELKLNGGTCIAGSNAGTYLTVEYCQISDFGQQGMSINGNNIGGGVFYGPDSDTVRYNHVYDGVKILSDVGGIYFYCTDPTEQVYIYKNIVHDLYGNGSGSHTGHAGAHGIYSDQPYDPYFGGVLITENTTYNISGAGVFIHCTYQNQDATYNTTFNCDIGLLISVYYGETSIDLLNNTVYAKEFDTDGGDQIMVSWAYNSTGNFDNNTYVNHYNSSDIFNRHVSGSPYDYYYDFAGWKSYTGEDENSTFTNEIIGIDTIVANPNKTGLDITITGTALYGINGTSYGTTIDTIIPVFGSAIFWGDTITDITEN